MKKIILPLIFLASLNFYNCKTLPKEVSAKVEENGLKESINYDFLKDYFPEKENETINYYEEEIFAGLELPIILEDDNFLMNRLTVLGDNGTYYLMDVKDETSIHNFNVKRDRLEAMMILSSLGEYETYHILRDDSNENLKKFFEAWDRYYHATRKIKRLNIYQDQLKERKVPRNLENST